MNALEEIKYKKLYSKELYEWRKAHKICVQCGKEKAYKNYVCCLECRMEHNEKERNRVRTSEQIEHNNARARRYYDLLVAFGVCTKCKKRDAVKGKIFCETCRQKDLRRQKERFIKNGGTTREMFKYSNLCYFCGAPVMKGKKVCEKHYLSNFKNLEKANAVPKNPNHPFAVDESLRYLHTKSCY